MTINEIIFQYKNQIDFIDLEILIAHSLGKTREFVLMHPEYKIPLLKIKNLKLKISRRMRGEPVAYITGHKEFYGLDFIVNKHTLIPRPETELIVEDVTTLLRSMLRNKLRNSITVIDVGTGSGCIITSIAHNVEHGAWSENNKHCDPESITESNDECSELDFRFHGNDTIGFFATEISNDALKIAKKNAKNHGLDKKIRFLHGNLLEPIINSSVISHQSSVIITANLPYLSDEIYNSAPIDVKNFEPKSALYSAEAGLAHYRELLNQIKSSVIDQQLSITLLLEISPEQKTPINKLVKSIFPKANIEFQKDLASKWRVCQICI